MDVNKELVEKVFDIWQSRNKMFGFRRSNSDRGLLDIARQLVLLDGRCELNYVAKIFGEWAASVALSDQVDVEIGFKVCCIGQHICWLAARARKRYDNHWDILQLGLSLTLLALDIGQSCEACSGSLAALEKMKQKFLSSRDEAMVDELI